MPAESAAVELARRDGHYLIRTRAASTPAQQNFSGVPVFDFDPDWIIKGSYLAYDSPQVARISTARSDTSLTAVLAGVMTAGGWAFVLVASMFAVITLAATYVPARRKRVAIPTASRSRSSARCGSPGSWKA